MNDDDEVDMLTMFRIIRLAIAYGHLSAGLPITDAELDDLTQLFIREMGGEGREPS